VELKKTNGKEERMKSKGNMKVAKYPNDCYHLSTDSTSHQIKEKVSIDTVIK
jgi:hypothetical protein